MAEYLAVGTAEVWVVYPRTRKVVVHRADGSARRLDEGDELDGGGVLPGFRAAVRSFFTRA